MLNKFRNYKGNVPVQIPLLLFLYTLIFLVSIEFVMLFWLQTSLSAAARQIAVKAATNTNFPAAAAAQRCTEAVQQVPASPPGYSDQVRQDFIQAMPAKAVTIPSFDEGVGVGGPVQGELRNRLSQAGAIKPNTFWGGSGNNMQNGGCFAVQNPSTRQITYYVIIHNGNCWPSLLKGLFNLINPSMPGLGWIEGRGSYQASAALNGQEQNLNRSALASGVRPFLVCRDDLCNFELGQSQRNLVDIDNEGVCRVNPNGWPAQDHPMRPKASTVNMGYGRQTYAIDQWPQFRGRLCTDCGPACPIVKPENRAGTDLPSSASSPSSNSNYCQGSNQNPPGLQRIVNCGDIDPLILIGLRYACKGTLYPDGRDVPAEVLARCDHYFKIVPCNFPNPDGLEMNKVVGDITNLDGQGRSIIIRRQNSNCTNTSVECRTDSAPVKPWVGPYGLTGFQFALTPDTWKLAERFHAFIKTQYELADNISSGQKHPLANPLDQLIPYHQFCDICPAGGPMCGFFGTCKDEEIPWTEARVNLRGQWWTNTSYYELNPMYFQLECKYRRDCQSRHCCKSLWNDPTGQGKTVLKGYCAQRAIDKTALEAMGAKVEPIAGGGAKVKMPCPIGVGSVSLGHAVWIYKGIPNADRDMNLRHDNLPREGGFPMCSTKAMLQFGDRAGECCAAQATFLGNESQCKIDAPFPSAPILAPATPCLGPNCTGPLLNNPACTVRSHKPTRTPPTEPLKPRCLPGQLGRGICVPKIVYNPLCKKFGNCQGPKPPHEIPKCLHPPCRPPHERPPTIDITNQIIINKILQIQPQINITQLTQIINQGNFGGPIDIGQLTNICNQLNIQIDQGQMNNILTEINQQITTQINQLNQITQITNGGLTYNPIDINNIVNIINQLSFTGGSIPNLPLQIPFSFPGGGGGNPNPNPNPGGGGGNPNPTPITPGGGGGNPGPGGCKKRCDLYYSPLFLSLDGSSIQALERTISFKFDPAEKQIGHYKRIKAHKAQGFLAIDLNKNGSIDDGSELFGNYTAKHSFQNGYEALEAIADQNKDKLITGTELNQLVLWQDANEDGISQSHEIQSLKQLGITQLDAGKNLSMQKTQIAEGIYAMPSSESGVLSGSGKGKSWDLWFEKYPNTQDFTKISFWQKFTKLFNKLV